MDFLRVSVLQQPLHSLLCTEAGQLQKVVFRLVGTRAVVWGQTSDSDRANYSALNSRQAGG